MIGLPRSAPMRLLIVFAHPRADSFGAALLATCVSAAQDAGHQLRVTDLYALGFDPVLSADEHRAYVSAAPDGALPPDLVRHIDDLRWAEGLIFVYPTWWSAQPAILKGWIDRVMRPGVAFSSDTPPRPLLTKIRLVGAVTTLGLPYWHWTLLLGAPGRKILLRGLRFCTGPRARTFWLALHRIDDTTQAQRQGFLAKVRARIARL